MLSDQSLLAFKRLYFNEYGENIPVEEARELAENLVNLYRAVYLPKKYYPIKEKAYEEAN